MGVSPTIAVVVVYNNIVTEYLFVEWKIVIYKFGKKKFIYAARSPEAFKWQIKIFGSGGKCRVQSRPDLKIRIPRPKIIRISDWIRIVSPYSRKCA